MYDAFALIDGMTAMGDGGEEGGDEGTMDFGVGANDDRKMTLDEWKVGRDKVQRYGFIALKNVSELSADAQFKQMNSGYTGMEKGGRAKDNVVMLAEFCRWIEVNEKGTEWGRLLLAGE